MFTPQSFGEPSFQAAGCFVCSVNLSKCNSSLFSRQRGTHFLSAPALQSANASIRRLCSALQISHVLVALCVGRFDSERASVNEANTPTQRERRSLFFHLFFFFLSLFATERRCPEESRCLLFSRLRRSFPAISRMQPGFSVLCGARGSPHLSSSVFYALIFTYH